jgi:hypothetical protein
MAAIIYLLCSATALVCCLLLWRGYRRCQLRLLFWSCLCFAALGLENLLLFADLILFPMQDLLLYRRFTALVAVGLLLHGMIWKSK